MNIDDDIYYDTVIIGSGLSGLIFSTLLKESENENNTIIIDKLNKLQILEKSDRIPYYSNQIVNIRGIKWSTQDIQTFVWDKTWQNSLNGAQLNEYSNKITSHCCNTTLNTYVKSKRIYIPTSNNKKSGRQKVILSQLFKNNTNNILVENILFIDIYNKIIYTASKKIHYKYLVSTMFLTELFKVTNLNIDYIKLPCFCIPFNIYYCDINAEGIYKVFYCVNKEIKINRVAYLNNRIFVESRSNLRFNEFDLLTRKFLNDIETTINLQDISHFSYNVEHNFRLVNNDDCETEKLKKYLEKYNIYLLGRYAEWRYKLTEDIWNDAKSIIKKMS